MFERFTDRARQAIILAQEEARQMGHDYIGSDHLLLGLLREEEGLAARVLAQLGVSYQEALAQVVGIAGLGDGTVYGQIPFTPRAKKVLELALREALSLGHNYVGTEHILLGMVREGGGVSIRALENLGADAEQVHNCVIDSLSPAGSPRRWAY